MSATDPALGTAPVDHAVVLLQFRGKAVGAHMSSANAPLPKTRTIPDAVATRMRLAARRR
jgi:hypothetical protein